MVAKSWYSVRACAINIFGIVANGNMGYSSKKIIYSVFLTGTLPKKLKYGKPRLGESTAT